MNMYKKDKILSTIDRFISELGVIGVAVDWMAEKVVPKGVVRAEPHCPYTEYQCWTDTNCPAPYYRRCKSRECDPCYQYPACGSWSPTWCYPG